MIRISLGTTLIFHQIVNGLGKFFQRVAKDCKTVVATSAQPPANVITGVAMIDALPRLAAYLAHAAAIMLKFLPLPCGQSVSRPEV
jgi:hypothetical protein